MESIILTKKALDLLEKIYVDNLESALVDDTFDTSIEVVEFIGTLSGHFGKLKTDEIEIFINDKNEKTFEQLIKEREKHSY